MPRTLTVENINFTFDNSWDVEKYDDHRDTRGFVGVVANRKAVDLIACRIGTAYFIEVKDYRGHRIAEQVEVDW